MTPRRAGVQALVDLVDIEASRDPQTVAQVVEIADRSGVKVIVSHHDFESTPSEEELVAILRSQRRAGADLPKIAVTPRGPRDRKSRRLNSSHVASSYAVFCLEKKVALAR